MGSDSSIHDVFTPEKIKKLQKDLLEEPIDPAWDHECECYDSQAPLGQLHARFCYEILWELGELPEGVPKWEKWEREHGGGEK